MGVRRDIDLIRNAFYDSTDNGEINLHNRTSYDNETIRLPLKERVVSQPRPPTRNLEALAEHFLEVASKRHIAEGKTAEEARKIIIAAFAAHEVNCPSIDEFDSMDQLILSSW